MFGLWEVTGASGFKGQYSSTTYTYLYKKKYACRCINWAQGVTEDTMVKGGWVVWSEGEEEWMCLNVGYIIFMYETVKQKYLKFLK